MRRRTQLLRENGMKYREEQNISDLRQSYLNLRTQILEKKYGDVDKMSMNSFNNRSSRANSKSVSIDSQSLNYDWRENISKRIHGSNSICGVSHSLAPQTNLKNSIVGVVCLPCKSCHERNKKKG